VQNFLNFIISNLCWEVILVVLIFGRKYLVDRFIKAPKIFRLLSLHNEPSRIWRKGIYARDRFMNIYESKMPLRSTSERMYGNGMEGAVWGNDYIDKYLLDDYGLVEVYNESGLSYVRPKSTRLTKIVYQLIKRLEEREKQQLQKFEKNRKKPS
jgi:hypothetical protein